MKVTLHQLQVLRTVKEHETITSAANVLHITQPAVSNILKQLEIGVGSAITETVGKKIFLTETGHHLVATAEKINVLLDQTQSDINALHGKLSGTMRVTIVSTAKCFVPKLLGGFRHEHPDVNIQLKVCNRQEAIQSIKNNESDFLIMSQPPTDLPVDTQLFYKDQLVVAASPEMSTGTRKKPLSHFENCEWVIREVGSGTRIVMQKLFKQHNMSPRIMMEVGDNESIKQLIMADMGISIVSKQSIELELAHHFIQILPVTGFPMPHPWYLVTHKGKQPRRIVKAFKEWIL